MSITTGISLIALIILGILFFAGKELRTYFWIGVALLVVFWAYCLFRGPRESEYCQEYVKCGNGGYIMLIHYGKCPEYHPLKKDIVEIKHFHKYKNYLYCPICMDDMEMDIFDAVSSRNIWISYKSNEAYEYYDEMPNEARHNWYIEGDLMIDTSHRKHIISVSRRSDELLPLSPMDIPEAYSYLRNNVK